MYLNFNHLNPNLTIKHIGQVETKHSKQGKKKTKNKKSFFY